MLPRRVEDGRNPGTMAEATAREAWRMVVRGRVQGVGFRAFTARRAEALGLVGWVRNRDDGTVELEVEGASAELEELRRHLRQGPRYGRVDSVDEELLEGLRNFETFEIRFR